MPNVECQCYICMESPNLIIPITTFNDDGHDIKYICLGCREEQKNGVG